MEQSSREALFHLEDVAKEEEELRFDSFSVKDAMRLAKIMMELSENAENPTAFEIELNGVIVFKYMPEGTGKYNELWMEKKLKTVHTMQMSTMKAWCWMESLGAKRINTGLLPESDLVLCGGGFPIHVKGTGIVGAIAVSGPGDQNDHIMAVESLRSFVKQNESHSN